MTPRDESEPFDWFGALERSAREAAELRGSAPLRLVVICLCGKGDSAENVITQPVDLTDAGEDVAAVLNEGGRPCRGCGHYIHHGARCVVRYFGATTTVRDHYHPECAEI